MNKTTHERARDPNVILTVLVHVDVLWYLIKCARPSVVVTTKWQILSMNFIHMMKYCVNSYIRSTAAWSVRGRNKTSDIFQTNAFSWLTIMVFWFWSRRTHRHGDHDILLVTSFMAWYTMGLLSDTYNCGVRMRREHRERFPRHRGLEIPACTTAHAWRTCRDACRDH